MSENGTDTGNGYSTDVPRQEEPTSESGVRRIEGHVVAIMALVILSLIGIGITDFAPERSHWYWIAMVPVFAVGCIVIEWSRRKARGESGIAVIRHQLWSWLGVFGAVNLVYFLLRAGRLDSENTGLVVLLVLALATFLCGLNLDWRLSLLGIFLALALMVATYVEEYLWMLILIPVLLAVFYGAWKVYRRRRWRSS